MTLTKQQRRNLYWRMYVTAAGIAELMTAEEVYKAGFWYDSALYPDGSEEGLPFGMCGLLDILYENVSIYDRPELYPSELPELYALRPFNAGGYWFDQGEWKPRAELLLKAYKATF